MKQLIVVLSVILFLALCHIGRMGQAASVQLETDLKNSEGYKEALEIFSDRGSLQGKADKAIDALIKTTVGELKKRGHETLAETIRMDYQGRYKGFVYSFKPGMTARNIGDHEAIAWLKKIHDDIEFVIGRKICDALRIHDLLILSYTIPVVFSCIDKVDPVEYFLHYSPFLGITAYWVSYAGCTVVTFSSGVMFLCSLVGMGCERAATALIAPMTLQGSYKLFCGK